MRTGSLKWLALAVLSCPGVRAENLVANPGFESGIAPWFARGGETLTRTASDAHSGNWSLRVSDRGATWQGPALSLQALLEPGRSYRVSAWVKVAGDSAQPFRITVQKTDDAGNRFLGVILSRGFADRWSQLVEVYEHSAYGTLTRLDLFLEQPAPGVDFYVDDVVVEALPADWQAAAEQRIEELRKRDLAVTVRDAQGQPVAGAEVRMRQLGRAFPIGTAINAGVLRQNPKYRDYIAAHFNWATHENAAKWYANEAVQGVETYADADAVLDWADANGIRMHGHTLFWAPPQWQPGWVPGLSDEALAAAVENRLASAVGHFKGRFEHWDVNNEMLHGSFFEDRLGPDIRQWMFERTREIDPDAALFVNEYNVLSAAETDLYALQVQDFLDRGFPLGAIGMQGHFTGVNPWQIQVRLDKMGQFGLPVWVTEFDVTEADQAQRADALETFFRSAFGHPAVAGIILWGFWEGAHWKGPDAALVNQDWTLTPAGQRFEDLLAEWTSDETAVTDAGGVARARLFHGTYGISVSAPGGAVATAQVDVLDSEGEFAVDVVLEPARAAPPIRLREFGGHGSAPGSFDTPAGVDVDSLGRIVVADSANDRIQVCERTGACRAFGTAGGQAGEFCKPLDVAIDRRDRILVADSCNHRVQVCNEEGRCTAFGGPDQFDTPGSVAVDGAGRILVGDTFNGRIQVCDLAGACGSVGALVDDPGNFQPGEFGYIQGVAADQQGRILVTEDIGGAARKALHACYLGNCTVTRILELPGDVAVDRFNRIHLNENGALQRCDHAGRCTAVVLTEPLSAGSRLAFTAGNELVVSDPQNHQLRIYAAVPVLRMNAGLNDAWLNTATVGQGFFIDVFPVIGGVFAGWFTFDAVLPDPGVGAFLGVPEHRWLTAFGHYQHNRAELFIELTSGGVFDAAQPAPESTVIGRLILQFETCRQATVSYELPGIDAYLRTIPLWRIADDNAALCEALGW
jgi:endo-1,4-beta-xylanase